MIAYNIVNTAAHLERVTAKEVIKFSAGGFRDFTRIAASDPTMWRDVFLNNKEAVLEMLGRFSEDLTALQRAIRFGDGDTLFKLFSESRAIRRGIIQAGQDTAEPDFGRGKGGAGSRTGKAWGSRRRCNIAIAAVADCVPIADCRAMPTCPKQNRGEGHRRGVSWEKTLSGISAARASRSGPLDLAGLEVELDELALLGRAREQDGCGPRWRRARRRAGGCRRGSATGLRGRRGRSRELCAAGRLALDEDVVACRQGRAVDKRINGVDVALAGRAGPEVEALANVWSGFLEQSDLGCRAGPELTNFRKIDDTR